MLSAPESPCPRCGGTGIVPGTEEPEINASGEPCDCQIHPTTPETRMRPVSVESPGNDGFRYEPVEQDTPDPDVIEMTAGEWNTALQASLDDLGITWDELAEQARTGDFSSLRARKLWLTAGPQGFLNAPESHQEDQ